MTLTDKLKTVRTVVLGAILGVAGTLAAQKMYLSGNHYESFDENPAYNDEYQFSVKMSEMPVGKVTKIDALKREERDLLLRVANASENLAEKRHSQIYVVFNGYPVKISRAEIPFGGGGHIRIEVKDFNKSPYYATRHTKRPNDELHLFFSHKDGSGQGSSYPGVIGKFPYLPGYKGSPERIRSAPFFDDARNDLIYASRLLSWMGY